MARKLRVEYAGALNHVMNRGDRREPIFKDDTDRRRFLETLDEACGKTGWRVHAWCLMENHFHLVVETPSPNLVAGMKWLLGVYTGRFNRRHNLSGHVFSGRYKALVVDGSGNGYLKTVCDYVHLNPVRAGLLTKDQPLTDFPWSSYPEYLRNPEKRPRWLRVDKLLGEHRIPKDSPAGRQQFKLRMEQIQNLADQDQWASLRSGWYLGDRRFRQELLAQMKERRTEHHYGEEAQLTDIERAETMVQNEIKKLKWTEEDLQQKRKGDLKKARIALRLRRETTMTFQWIADRLKMGAPGALANRLRTFLVDGE